MSTTKAEITRKSFATKIYYRRLNRTSVHISNASNQHTIITPLTSEPFSLLTVLFGSFIVAWACNPSIHFFSYKYFVFVYEFVHLNARRIKARRRWEKTSRFTYVMYIYFNSLAFNYCLTCCMLFPSQRCNLFRPSFDSTMYGRLLRIVWALVKRGEPQVNIDWATSD